MLVARLGENTQGFFRNIAISRRRLRHGLAEASNRGGWLRQSNLAARSKIFEFEKRVARRAGAREHESFGCGKLVGVTTSEDFDRRLKQDFDVQPEAPVIDIPE